MAVTIAHEAADTAEAVALLKARDAESDEIYPPSSQFQIPIDKHVDERILFLVARENGVAIGCGALQLHDGFGELKSIYVTPAARGQKVGGQIVQALESIAHGVAISELKLETGTERPAAIRMYERLGYRRCSRFGTYPEDPLSIYMSKVLDRSRTRDSGAAA